MTHTFMETQHISGLPGIAVRLGRALENWGREVSKPIDREAQRRDFERQVGNEARMLHAERLVRHYR
ncbi:hypothetical protein [Pseudolysinimonas sp.]|uniref:hypothetical protein n=1 Tax=Pseudolysinimonas sp. TaxID=2680009 RepID=UPI00286C6505|nr:hypothetical protein [Pseudolysinimonas sp.]